MLPALAAQAGLRLSAGVWLDSRRPNNEREIAAIIDAVPRHPGIERVIAGNESQLRGVLAPSELYGYLDRLRAALPVPVSTAEPWHVWLRQPALVDHVDFITVHLLPYWEGLPVEHGGRLRAATPERGAPAISGQAGGDRRNRLAEPRRPRGGGRGDAGRAGRLRACLSRTGRPTGRRLLPAGGGPISRGSGPPRAQSVLTGGCWTRARRAKFAFTGTLQADPFWPGKALGLVGPGPAGDPALADRFFADAAGRPDFLCAQPAGGAFLRRAARDGVACGLPAAARSSCRWPCCCRHWR
jgi:hypothetical protein